MEKYRKIELIGCGRDCEVWSAIDRDSGGAIALKIYSCDDASRAGREFEACSGLSHPCLLRPLGHFIEEGHPVLVMPLCTGRSVEGLAGYLSESSLWRLIRDVSGALSAIHAEGSAHLEVSPSHILLSDDGRFILSGFGSCATAPAGYRFDAPELAAGNGSAASDIWSLGATAFHLLLGTYPFNGMGGRTQRPDSPLPFMRQSLPEISGTVCRCLSYDPASRPTAAGLSRLAEDNLQRLLSSRPSRPLKESSSTHSAPYRAGDFWPDPMIPPQS